MIAILKLFTTPIVLIIAMLLMGLVAIAIFSRFPRARRFGICLVFFGLLVLYILSIKPVSNILAYILEVRYKPYALDAIPDLDAVVILGGGFIPSGTFQKFPEANRATYSRLFNGVKIFKNSGARMLVLSGGTPLPRCTDSDAEVMKDIAERLGVPQDAIIIESKSKNTKEQVIEVAKIFSAGSKSRIGVVTSAIHMLRVEIEFRKRLGGNIIIPIAVNYISCAPNPRFDIVALVPSADELLQSTCAIHELIGMVWYAL